MDDAGDHYQQQMLRIYEEYQSQCERRALVDFAELLLRAHELWRDRPDVLQHYQQRFQHILVDEFQDTNTIQYAWLRLLAGPRDNLFVVGDDDQSIYGWRGARVEHMHSFRADYPATRLLRLEQNYRSTGTILKAANALIANNPSRLGKNLWTEDGEGEPISVYAAYNEVDEARLVVERIRQHVEQGHLRSEAAVLYRTNAQSRLFEEALIQVGMPYRVYGGLRFFERAEIKDALAYLRLLANGDDDPSFERAVNMPPRGIGPRTLEAVRAQARELGGSLWRAAHELVELKTLPARAINALNGFLELIEQLRGAKGDAELADQAARVVGDSRLPEHFSRARTARARTASRTWRNWSTPRASSLTRAKTTRSDPLSAFLANAALEAGETQGGADEDCVQLMTLHSAKGLGVPTGVHGRGGGGPVPPQPVGGRPDSASRKSAVCVMWA